MKADVFYSPSKLACQSLRLAPKGEKHNGEDTCCAMCRAPIRKGDIAAPLDLPRSFADQVHLLKESQHLCGYCNTAADQDVLRAFQREVITEHGTYNLNHDTSRVWLWLTPPEPPFVLVINNSAAAFAAFHYVWRTPVTLSRDLIQAMMDGKVYQVRRPMLLQAIEDSRFLTQELNDMAAQGKKKKGKSVYAHCWQFPDRKGKEDGHGVLTRTVHELEQTAAVRAAIRRCQNLGEGELMALASIIKSKPVEPAMPPLKTTLS